ncbi:LysR family transcriptional regulator [Deefgea sp. CFH1-16]|uniref:LysR family transcriptional regulator n=1 Tax=Deefgea sp. CFH1-16 TaxID=2675457 RepID=UPI0015F50E72|nr:LysR family transcriptional regulator [Deefgea sp. CFH1-16]MBM5574226.1 LysR family transcriptional regulator [Deefgea sp. CFH1-16]
MKTKLLPEALLAFESLARLGSFTAAAQEMSCAKSHVSQLIGQLELELSSVLLLRSTRRISLTESGQTLLIHAQALRELLGQVRLDIEDTQQHIEGELFISTTPSMAQYVIGPLMAQFAKLQPKLNIRVDANNRIQDPILEGIDFCIRSGTVGDERLVGRLAGHSLEKLYASPHYLQQAPQLHSPADLTHHDILINDEYQTTRQWQMQSAGAKFTVDLQPVLCSNNNPTLAMSAVAGHGIALLPDIVGESYCRLGLLQAVLPQWYEKPTPIYLVYPQRSAMPKKYRAFIDFILPELKARLSSSAAD